MERQQPPLYVSAYRHIHDLFVAAGATNVVWAWCPNVTDVDGGNRHTMGYYPGDRYVDWTGVDGYNWGTKNGGWQSFHEVFRNIYPLLAKKKKPILIGEMSSAETGGDKSKWIDEIIPTLRNSFPLVKGIIWLDVNKEADWRISSSPRTAKKLERAEKEGLGSETQLSFLGLSRDVRIVEVTCYRSISRSLILCELAFTGCCGSPIIHPGSSPVGSVS